MPQTVNHHIDRYMYEIGKHQSNPAAIYELLDIYYQRVVYTPLKSDSDMGCQPFPMELLQSVEERSSGVVSALKQLLSMGFEINGSAGGFNPLMLAVGNGDAPMVGFLIEHGADVHTWPEMGDDPEYMMRNYYLDDIDIHFMDECFANDKDDVYLGALRKTAIALAEEGHRGPYNGHCLTIDREGNVSFSAPKMKF